MKDMGKEEVWLSSILRENTVLHHKQSEIDKRRNLKKTYSENMSQKLQGFSWQVFYLKPKNGDMVQISCQIQKISGRNVL